MTVYSNLFDLQVRIARPREGQTCMQLFGFLVALGVGVGMGTWLWTWVFPPHHSTHITTGSRFYLSGITWMADACYLGFSCFDSITDFASHSWLELFLGISMQLEGRHNCSSQLATCVDISVVGQRKQFFSLEKIEGMGQNHSVCFYRKLGGLTIQHSENYLTSLNDPYSHATCFCHRCLQESSQITINKTVGRIPGLLFIELELGKHL